MPQNDQVYIKLQKHLDRQAVGFPATKTGVEIRILKHIFIPEEAEIASLLSYKFEPLKIIFSRVEHLVESAAKLAKILDRIQKKGGIEFKIKNLASHCAGKYYRILTSRWRIAALTIGAIIMCAIADLS